ncbi:MAG: TIGR00730 family Rossman fold protein, partial [Cytophagales bacterium]|nr:TIGR00730 family Rossman fold protein [Cytophagales bacterium]
MKSIVVFCGSSSGNFPIYKDTAYQLGKLLASKGIDIVYGGNNVGLMGAVADGALDHGGKVTGVLPRFLESKEAAHLGLTKIIMVDTMHERKWIMNQLSDAVITLPGGFGTMEEFFEMLTWHQLGLHNKPV